MPWISPQGIFTTLMQKVSFVFVNIWSKIMCEDQLHRQSTFYFLDISTRIMIRKQDRLGITLVSLIIEWRPCLFPELVLREFMQNVSVVFVNTWSRIMCENQLHKQSTFVFLHMSPKIMAQKRDRAVEAIFEFTSATISKWVFVCYEHQFSFIVALNKHAKQKFRTYTLFEIETEGNSKMIYWS